MNPKTKTWTLEIREDLAEEFISEFTLEESLSKWVEVLIWYFLSDGLELEDKLLLAGDFKRAMRERDTEAPNEIPS